MRDTSNEDTSIFDPGTVSQAFPSELKTHTTEDGAGGILGSFGTTEAPTTLRSQGQNPQPDTAQKVDGQAQTIITSSGVILVRNTAAKAGFKTYTLDQVKAYQILPYDPQRKIARLWNPPSALPMQVVQVPNPGAGNVFSFTPPSAVPYTLDGIYLLFQTDAVAGNRFVQVVAVDPSGRSLFYTAAAAQAASLNVFYSFSKQFSAAATVTNGRALIPLDGNVQFNPGTTFNLSVAAIDVGDNMTQCEYMYTPTQLPGVIIGPESEVSNYVGSGTDLIPTGCVLLPGVPTASPTILEYTAVSEVYACSAVAGSAALAVEMETYGGMAGVG